ncbi:hypothetical protein [Domibacillus indicus]|uniref:hypothetical protein n=1 Tax=Domibacillus indicus TaxID=1437523 RepID=UPI0012E0560F|nr:hypothetical protein [Domibacillus indicus]
MQGLIFALLSSGFILFASSLYHMKEAHRSRNHLLKKRAGQFSLISVLSVMAAILLSYR